MDLNFAATRYELTRALILWLNLQWFKLNEALLDEIFDLLIVFWHARECIHKVAITHQVNNRNVLNLQVKQESMLLLKQSKKMGGSLTYSKELRNILMRVYVHVEVLNLALMRLDGVDEHRFEDVAWSAPRSASLDHNWTLAVLQGILPIAIRLHLPNVARLAYKVGTRASVCP